MGHRFEPDRLLLSVKGGPSISIMGSGMVGPYLSYLTFRHLLVYFNFTLSAQGATAVSEMSCPVYTALQFSNTLIVYGYVPLDQHRAGGRSIVRGNGG